MEEQQHTKTAVDIDTVRVHKINLNCRAPVSKATSWQPIMRTLFWNINPYDKTSQPKTGFIRKARARIAFC